jgi:hypothetical protein
MGAVSAPSCGVGGVRGRQRSAMSVSAWDGPSRRAAHGGSGLGVRSERYICGCVRCAAENRRAAAARSGIIGLTIRSSSCCHRMAVRYAAVSPRRSHSVPASHAVIWMGAAPAPSCGVGGVRGRQRSAMSVSAVVSAMTPHGTAVRGERRMGGPDLACDPSDKCVGASAALLRTAAQRRQGPGSSG